MPEPVLKTGVKRKEDVASTVPEDPRLEWEKVDFCLPVGALESPVPLQSRVVVHTEPTGAGADRFRLAQIRLKSLQASRSLKSLLVTSPLPGDGKTTVALNLATVLSENGKVPVLLLEMDVYRPTVLKRLDLKPWAGLTECFRSGEDPMLAVRRINPLGFYLLPAGEQLYGDAVILQSTFASQLIKGLSASTFGWVIIDSPPTTPIADVLALSAHADGVLLVARAGQTPRESIEESIRNLGREHMVGIILNGAEGLNRIYSKYYGYGNSCANAKQTNPTSRTSLGLDEPAK